MLAKQFLILLLSVITFSAVNAQDGEQEIRQLLDERDAQIKELLGPKGNEYTQEQRDEIKNIVNDVIDFRDMASQALGSTFEEISTEERDEFVSLFSTIIRDNSLNRLDIYRADVTYNSIDVTNSTAKVETTARIDNVRTPVGYNLEKKEDEWVVTDLIIDEVSTAESYNRQFQSIIRQRGFDALINNLRRRAERAST
ncbi:MAG: ABC transporter substrate-binding protein [Balneolaceae bacterium]